MYFDCAKRAAFAQIGRFCFVATMIINWKSVGWISSLLAATALIVYGASQVAQRDRQVRLMRDFRQHALFPLATGFGSIDGVPSDPRLHCVTLPTGIHLALLPTSKNWLDRRFPGYEDWTVISDRMEPGDDIYAYNNIPHPPPGVTDFTGLGGGYVVLRGWCLVGRFEAWVE
jgi:hypothetical protein